MNDLRPGDTVWVRTEDGPKRGVICTVWHYVALVEFPEGMRDEMRDEMYKSEKECNEEINETHN